MNGKAVQTLRQRYGVDNIQKISEVSAKARKSQYANWRKCIEDIFPLKVALQGHPTQLLDDSDLKIYVLKESLSIKFFKQYGFRINPRFARRHLTLGLVDSTTVYQAIRFESIKGEIKLVDLGIVDGFSNVGGYAKLMYCAVDTMGIDAFTCELPRHLANNELLDALSIQKESEGSYEIYWEVAENSWKRLTWQDDLNEVKSAQYITSDYLDLYKYVKP